MITICGEKMRFLKINVINTIYGDCRQFSAKKWRFLKINVMITMCGYFHQFLEKIDVFNKPML
jgi:hypothetical protein